LNVNIEELTHERKQKIIAEMHNCPVGGIQRTNERIKLYLSWPLPLTIRDTKTTPWEKICLDIVGPLPATEGGMKYILTCQDNLSKYFIAIHLQNQTAEEVTNAFVKNIVSIYGIPTEVTTDKGSNFMSEVFKRICKLFKIEKVHTTAYHPESNGALERPHKTLTNYLRCFCDKKLNNWDEWLPFACFTYNTTPHSVKKYTPYEVLFGRTANIPGKLQRQPQPLYNIDDIVMDIKQKMQSCQQIAKEILIKFTDLQRQKVKFNEYAFKENGLALLKVENRQKLDPLWNGPYEIKKIEGSNAIIQEVGKRRHHEVHINRLKPYFFRSLSENLTVTLCIWWRMLQGQTIDEVDSRTGIYFDEIGTVLFCPMKWKVVIYINLEPTRELWKQTKAHQRKITEFCQKIKDKNLYHYTDCVAFGQYMRSKGKYIDNLKDLVAEYLTDNNQSSNHRSKRGISNFVGEISKILF
jgi:hypothetical protein